MGRLGYIALLVAALWPVWPWYNERTVEQSGNGYALVALLTAVVLTWRKGSGDGPFVPPVAGILLTLLYAGLYLVAPVEVFATVGFMALAVTCGWHRKNWHQKNWHQKKKGSILALCGLFVLALPSLPWLDFYVGYPLRVMVTHMVAPLLRMGGLAVGAEGTGLLYAGQLISVDAPCSGIRMLWSGGYLVFTLAVLFGLSAGRTMLGGMITLVTVVLANVLRASALFYLEAEIIPDGEGAHELVGAGMFVAVAVITYGVVSRLSRKGRVAEPDRCVHGVRPNPIRPAAKHPAATHPIATRWRIAAWVTVCVVAALVPAFRADPVRPVAKATFPGWPAGFEGRPLTRLPLTDIETDFNAEFPGKVARFSDGSREIIMRFIDTPSRFVHSATHCLGAYGWTIQPRPLYTDQWSRRWGRAEATRNNETMVTREIFLATDGSSEADVSAWYWQATMNRSQGPWWHISVTKKRRN